MSRLFYSRIARRFAANIKVRIEVEIWPRVRDEFDFRWICEKELHRSSRSIYSRKRIAKKNKKIDIARKILRFQFLTMNILTSKKIILFWHSSVYSWASRKSSTRFLWDVIIRRLLVRRLNYTHHEADQC